MCPEGLVILRLLRDRHPLRILGPLGGGNLLDQAAVARLVDTVAAERKLRDKKNAAAKARKAERTAARIEAARAKLPSILGALSSQPHPSRYYAEQGRTLLDYVNWCLENRAGEKAAFIIERAS